MHFYESLKSRKELSSFILYCQNHPEERFWQALQNWSGYTSIMAVTYIGRRFDGGIVNQTHNTFYIKGRRHDEKS
jgi:hypothetical protein